MERPSPPPVRACLFDMDGLLINTEDLYSICTNTVLHEYNRPSMPWSIKAQLQGRPGSESTKIFEAWAQLPISTDEFNQKQAGIQAKIFPTSQPLPGVSELLQRLTAAHIPIALATSSYAVNFRRKTSHLPDLFAHFPPSQQILGDDVRIPRGRGKPAPDIYLLALSTINDTRQARDEDQIRPEECLVFEDSVPGVEAGRRAGMQVLWCPHLELLAEYRGREKDVLFGALDNDEDQTSIAETTHSERPIPDFSHDKVSSVDARTSGNDSWANLVTTLEQLNLDRYGIKVKQGD